MVIAPPLAATSPPVKRRPLMVTAIRSAESSFMLNIRLPLPLFTVRRGVIAAGVNGEQLGAGAFDRDVVGDFQFAHREQDGGRAAAVRAGSKRIVSVLGHWLASSIGFAKREVADAEIAVRFVGERVDYQVEIARFLKLVRADVDPAVDDAGKWLAALVVQRHAGAGFRVEIARIDRRAAGEKRVGEQLAAVRQCWAAVVGQRASSGSAIPVRSPAASNSAIAFPEPMRL